jgi:hypothetical protein
VVAVSYEISGYQFTINTSNRRLYRKYNQVSDLRSEQFPALPTKKNVKCKITQPNK